jgi:hypothetical protein
MKCATEIMETSVADPECLFRILIFIHPGSRIKQQQQKRRGENLLSYLFCGQKYHKIENFYFILVQEKNLTENERRKGSKKVTKIKSLGDKKRKLTEIKVAA